MLNGYELKLNLRETLRGQNGKGLYGPGETTALLVNLSMRTPRELGYCVLCRGMHPVAELAEVSRKNQRSGGAGKHYSCMELAKVGLDPIPTRDFCILCNGSGELAINGIEKCRVCKGRGTVERNEMVEE
jgi:DnaJ-class molecular chaperone